MVAEVTDSALAHKRIRLKSCCRPLFLASRSRIDVRLADHEFQWTKVYQGCSASAACVDSMMLISQQSSQRRFVGEAEGSSSTLTSTPAGRLSLFGMSDPYLPDDLINDPHQSDKRYRLEFVLNISPAIWSV